MIGFNMSNPSTWPTAPRWRPRPEKARTVDHLRAKGPVLRAAPRVTLGAMLLKRLLCLIEGHRYNHKLQPEGSVTVSCNRCGRTSNPADLKR